MSRTQYAVGCGVLDDDTGSFGGGGATVVGDSPSAGANIKDYELASGSGKGKAHIVHGIPLEAAPDLATKFGSGSGDYNPKNSSLFVRIGDDGVLPALYTLNERLKSVSLITLAVSSTRPIIEPRGFQVYKMNILADREPVSWTGHEIQPGEIGLINHGGIPEILTKAGRYPRFPLR